jgi:hypothetical protein
VSLPSDFAKDGLRPCKLVRYACFLARAEWPGFDLHQDERSFYLTPIKAAANRGI